jgi:hypothetical protein
MIFGREVLIAIQVDLDAVIFNSMSSTILKWLKFRVVGGGGMIFSLAQQWFGIV